MLTSNKYFTRLYLKIVTNAQSRTLPTDMYKERHHITPTSLGGLNQKSNLVWLTGREHFICHYLLTKMTTGNQRSKMLYAIMGMRAKNRYQHRYESRVTARVYEKFRIEHAANHSKTMKGRPAWNKGIPQTDEYKVNMIAALKNRKKMSPDVKAKWISDIKNTLTGTNRSEKTKQNISLALKGKPKGPMSEEEKLKRSLKQKGVPKVKTHSANVAAAMTGNIAINKDNIEKKVKQPDLQTWLNQGWSIGGKKRI